MKTALFVLISLLAFSTAIYAKPYVVPATAEERAKLADKLDQSDNEEAAVHAALLTVAIINEDKFTEPNVKAGQAKIKALKKKYPQRMEIQAALGAVTTMQASFVKNAGKAMRFVKKGFRFLDRAVKKAPTSLDIRLQRANVALAVPKFLGRLRYAQEDFQYVLDNTNITELKDVARFGLAKVAKKNGDTQGAQTLLKAILNSDSSAYNQQAQALLNSL